jgi:alpha-beta hydrolase superfamily lysophospholipase
VEARASAIEAPPSSPRESTPIRRQETRLATSGSGSLFRCSWSPPQASRVLVLVHGFGEHSLRYDHFGAWFARRGCAVHAYDLRGHGRSTGRRGHVDRFDQYLDDTCAILERVRGEHPGLRPTLIGHSLGGLVVSSVARERKPDVASFITSGAALAPSPDLSKLKIVLAKGLRFVAPRLSMEVGIDPRSLSNDPEVVQRYRDDPLVHGRMSSSHAVEMLAAIERTQAGGADVDLPMLLLHGADDPLCLKGGSEAFYQSLPGADAEGRGTPLAPPRCELRIYPGMRHEIFNEKGHEEVFEDLLGWVIQLEREASCDP